MTTELVAIRGNQTLALYGKPFHLIAHIGTGIATIERQQERGPYQNGVTDLGYRLEPRTINLPIQIEGDTRAHADALRSQLTRFFRPLPRTPVRLRFRRDDGAYRQIDTFLIGQTDFANTLDDRHDRFQKCVLQLRAADPLFYDPALQNLIFDIGSGGSSGFQVPMEVPLLVTAGVNIDAIQPITYHGDEDEYPVLFVTGPADDVVITNETIGAKLDFTGTTIADGDTYTIDLRYAIKTITDSNGDNQIAKLTDDSDLSTWRLAADPEAPAGINDIRVQIPDEVTAATRVRIEFYNRYLAL